MRNDPPTWLAVENDDDEFVLAEHALRRAQARVRLYRAQNGVEAQEYLTGQGRFSDRLAFPFPNLILSDVNMPLLGGLELLDWVKKHPPFCSISFVFLTNSNRASDRERAWALGANEYLVKPTRLADLSVLLTDLASRYGSLDA